MRDRWVTLFVVFCVLQIPLYVSLGRGDIAYDIAMKEAEKKLSSPEPSEQQLAAAAVALEDSETALRLVGGEDSRQARLNIQRAVLAWNQRKMTEADAYFRKAIEQFEATHGPDAFHTCALNLRYAEFLMLSYRYQEALQRFQLGVKAVEETLGPGNPFAVRMIFRQVSLLTYLGRNGEAASLAASYLPALLENAGHFEEPYLTQVAGSLDVLSRGRFPQVSPVWPAPGGRGWRQALLRAREEGVERMAEQGGEP
jgi:tetratricopeptide (TPR) repeat protein